MKKILIIFAIIITILCSSKEEQLVIPKDSIRFRVIAASNKDSDQQIKKKVVNNLKVKIEDLSTKSNTLEEYKSNIKKELPEFNTIVEDTLNNTNYKINYGLNYFPKKEFKGITYEEGNYESLVITIGDGLGENFWCVLFPPLCQVDNTKDVEYKSLVKEILNKYKKQA